MSIGDDEATLRPVGLVPSAGFGERLGMTTRSKEMLPVDGRPVIDHSVDRLLDSGVEHVVVVVREAKRDLVEHLRRRYPDEVALAYQSGPIGNLLDAIRAAAGPISNRDVYFSMADTAMFPNPFPAVIDRDLALLCFEVNDERWGQFGVLDPDRHRIVDKPTSYVSSICWGALAWGPAFTELLVQPHFADLTSVMNASAFSWRIAIEQYRDVGTMDGLDDEQLAVLKDE